MRNVILAATVTAALFICASAGADHTDLSYYLDAQGQRRPVTTPEDWQTRRRQILENMQRVMGPLPGNDQRAPLDLAQTEEVVLDGRVVRRRITYSTTPQQRVAAYLFIPPHEKGAKLPAILCLHPTGAPGKQIVSIPGVKQNRAYAFELAQRGYVTLAPDYPSFGDYTIDFDRNDGFTSGTMRAIWDNICAVDLLQSLPEVDGQNIGAIGHSLGGHNAIFTAVFEPRIKVVVSSCGFTRFHKYYEGNLKGWTSPRYMPAIARVHNNDPDRVPFDFPELIAALAPRPFFTNSPLRDANFEVSGVKDTIAAAASIYRLLGAEQKLVAIYPDVAHDFPDDARADAYRFLDLHTGNARGGR